MKKILLKIRKIGNPFVWVCSYLFVTATLNLSHAQSNPFDAGALLPDDKKDASVYDILAWIFSWGLRMLVIAAMAFGIGSVIFILYKAFQEARDRDDWGSFMKAIVWSLIIVIVVVLFSNLAWQWADAIENL